MDAHTKTEALLQYYVKLTQRLETVLDTQLDHMHGLLDSSLNAAAIDGLSEAVEMGERAKQLYCIQMRDPIATMLTAARQSNASLVPYEEQLRQKIWSNCDSTIGFLSSFSDTIERLTIQHGEIPPAPLTPSQLHALEALREHTTHTFIPAFLRIGNDYGNLRNVTTEKLAGLGGGWNLGSS